ncbi:hypothetical protein [Nocardioides flavus (ex Wang et al. 2016)]|uniref:hypothetical protein n=1 Tax=Nocardioides flavus (ex Wang et al. 2016) TaxID=2058780 RepID=UPI00174E79C8|nr:hypothetical protein [Nocardioides flavus (ex Wang et al. 2016)]
MDQFESKTTNELPAKLDAAYAAIKAKAPNAQVVVLGDPRAFGSSISCPVANGITSWRPRTSTPPRTCWTAPSPTGPLQPGSPYKSSIKSFGGHDMCASDPWVNGKSWSIADGHPPATATAWLRSGRALGHRLIRALRTECTP